MSPAEGLGAEEYVQLGSFRIRVRRSGEGPPLLLISGLGAAIEMWEPVTTRFRGRELIMFDLPGTGKSSRSRVPLRMRHNARLVTALLDRLGHDRVDVLGYSLGGAVAQELAYRTPSKVRRLILCATTAGAPGVPPSLLNIALLVSPARYYSTALAERIIPRLAGGRTARDPETLRAGIRRRQAEPPKLLGYALQLSATAGWSSHAWLHRVRHETLILHADDDPLVPIANARTIARKMPNARLQVLQDAGHLFLLDDPDVALGTIEAFLDDPGLAARR
jgi:poly(3-hydroxyoctanoate) depolymerase